MTDEKYNLRRSGKKFQLYPILTDKEGRIIDGNHRNKADSTWRKEVVPGVETDEDFLVARCVANWNRRKVSVEEKKQWINDLAEYYKNQGYNSLITGNEIVIKIVEITGLSQVTVNKYLDDKFKVYTNKNRKRKTIISASERIEKLLGKEILERHEKEVLEKSKQKKKSPKDTILKEEKTPVHPDFSSFFETRTQNIVKRITLPLVRFNMVEVEDLKEIEDTEKAEILKSIENAEKKLRQIKTYLQTK